MTTIDTSSWKEFKLSELFEITSTKSLDEGNLNFVSEGINFIGRVDENNGIKGKIKKQDFEPNEPFTITATVIGNYKYVKYQEEPYYCSQNINKLIPKFKINKEIALFMTTNIQKFISKWNEQQSGYKLEDLKNFVIKLPIKETEEIDFDYMEKYIENIENGKKNKLKSFLKNNLNTTTISEEEQKILNKNIIYKEFKINKIFEKIEISKINKKANDFPETKNNEYCIPLLTAGIKNNGLARYAKKEDCKTILSKVLSVSANGENSGSVFYQENEFAVLQDAYAIKLINENTINKYIGLFLATNLEKAIKELHDWTNKAGWKKIENNYISLPVKIKNNENYEYTINDIDFDYMEKYIKIIEKQTISKLYKNNFINF